MELVVKNLSFKNILNGITFSVKSGDVLAVAGKNGAGKTTLLLCLSGYLKYRGNVQLDNKEMKDIPLKERVNIINYLPQRFELFFPFTVYEFLKASTKRKKSEITEKAETLGIARLLNREISLLSGGERAKVLLLRILLIDPKVYLLDEPIAFFDIDMLPFMFQLTENLKKRGKIVLITAHDLSFLADVGDRFLGIASGRATFYPSKEEFLSALPKIFNTDILITEKNRETFIKPKLRR